MKKTFLSLLFILFIGGMYAQMPIILESDLQKLKAEAAANKSQSEKGFRSRSKTSEDEEQVASQDQEQQTQTQTDVATELSKLGTNSKISTTGTKTKDTKVDNTATTTKSSSVNRFRERQKKLKK